MIYEGDEGKTVEIYYWWVWSLVGGLRSASRHRVVTGGAVGVRCLVVTSVERETGKYFLTPVGLKDEETLLAVACSL